MNPAPDTLPDWTGTQLAMLWARWALNLPVWAIADDLGKSVQSIQNAVRRLDLPYRDPGAVNKASRARTLADQRAFLQASSDCEPLRTHAAQAAIVAAQFGVAWSGKRSDLAALNRTLNGIGHRPIFVPFRELTP